MKRLSRFLRLSPGEKYLLARVAVLLLLVRLGLTILPFRFVERLIAPAIRLARFGTGRPAYGIAAISWAVPAAARYVPRASCLTQALAAHILLSRRGFASRLQIGVKHDPRHGFAAHAWVLCEGRVVVGGGGHQAYTPLLGWEGESR